MAELTRRRMLGTGAAIAAGTTLATPAAALRSEPGAIGPLSPAGLAAVTALRRFCSEWYAADSKAADLECKADSPNYAAYKAAQVEAKALWDKREALAAEFAEKPIVTWDDIVLRAEACRLSGSLEFDLYDKDQHGGMLTALLEGIFSIAGCMPPAKEEDTAIPPGWVEPNPLTRAEWDAMTIDSGHAYDISFVGSFVAEHFGTADSFEKAAKYFDVPVGVIHGWNREDYIPFRWHHVVYSELHRTGLTMAPHLLGLTEAEAAGTAEHRRNHVTGGPAHA